MIEEEHQIGLTRAMQHSKTLEFACKLFDNQRRFGDHLVVFSGIEGRVGIPITPGFVDAVYKVAIGMDREAEEILNPRGTEDAEANAGVVDQHQHQSDYLRALEVGMKYIRVVEDGLKKDPNSSVELNAQLPSGERKSIPILSMDDTRLAVMKGFLWGTARELQIDGKEEAVRQIIKDYKQEIERE